MSLSTVTGGGGAPRAGRRVPQAGPSRGSRRSPPPAIRDVPPMLTPTPATRGWASARASTGSTTLSTTVPAAVPGRGITRLLERVAARGGDHGVDLVGRDLDPDEAGAVVLLDVQRLLGAALGQRHGLQRVEVPGLEQLAGDAGDGRRGQTQPLGEVPAGAGAEAQQVAVHGAGAVTAEVGHGRCRCGTRARPLVRGLVLIPLHPAQSSRATAPRPAPGGEHRGGAGAPHLPCFRRHLRPFAVCASGSTTPEGDHR